MEAQDYTITGLRAVRENLVTQRSPAEALDVADVPAEALDVADVPAEARDIADVPAETLDVADVPAEARDIADVPAEHFFTITGLMGCEGELVDAALSCGSQLITQRPPARHT
jgi:hypothetical protein